jgi:hypothetical protein
MGTIIEVLGCHVRRLEKNSGRYRVKISPGAWDRLITTPAEIFRRITLELQEIAEAESLIPPPFLGETRVESHTLPLADHTAVYDVDPSSRCITLVDVVPL